MLEQFIDQNYAAAVKTQEAFAHDLKMIEIMQPGAAFDETHAYNWMRKYGLFQWITQDVRHRIVRSVCESRDILGGLPDSGKEEAITKAFRLLLQNLYDAEPRLWLSASSKILWCRYPHDVAIYDSFVEKTLTVLQWLDGALIDLPRLGSRPEVRAEEDLEDVIGFYGRYERQVRCLLRQYESQMKELRDKTGANYPYDIRILDKLLWLAGRAHA